MKKFYLVFISCIVAFAIGEFVLRVIDIDTGRYKRYIFSTSPVFSMDNHGAVSYLPNITTRSRTIYSGIIENDVLWSTNNLGSIDHKDYFPNSTASRRIAFIGDSFTAGLSRDAEPWVPALRDQVAAVMNIEIFNLGVGATGIQHFPKLLESFYNKIPFDDIVILVITDDFFRGYWQPIITEEGIVLCGNAELHKESCLKKDPIIRIVKPDDNIFKIMEQLETRQPVTLKSFIEIFKVVQLFQNFRKTLLDKPETDIHQLPTEQQKILYDSIAALDMIRNTFPNAKIKLIHLPEKIEVIRGRYKLSLEELIENSGISYHSLLDSCSWSKDMYLARDTHPNKKGYANIARCVTKVLKLGGNS